MAETTPNTQRWLARMGFVTLAMLLIAAGLMPLDTMPDRMAPPDLLLAVTMAWAVRRPDHAPVLVIAAIWLLADLVFQRPPGLMAALVVLVTELLRRRAGQFRTMPFPLEWASVALAIAGITLVSRVVLAITGVTLPPIALSMISMALTILVYPVVVAGAYIFFGMARRAPGEVDTLGHRI